MLLCIFDDVLDLLWVEVGEMFIDLVFFNLVVLLCDVMVFFYLFVLEKNLCLIVDVVFDLILYCIGDFVWLW